MAKRESQGLQIALILMFMVSVVLAITTFVAYRKAEEATAKAKAADEAKQAAEDLVQQQSFWNSYFKHIVGAKTLSEAELKVTIPSVEGVRIVDPEQAVGYIRVTNFQKTTPRDFDAALWNLQQQGMKHLIVDLRGNPGGLLSASVEMADRFIKSGIIVSTKGRNPMEDFTHRAKATGTWRIPLVVLIDENSASASEIFAAAIADHQRGTIVGQRSYGKGSVQGIFPLNINGGGIRLTTAKFYSPKGREIHLHGVTPAVNVEHVAKPAIGSFTAEDTDVILRTGIQVCRQLTDTKSLAGR